MTDIDESETLSKAKALWSKPPYSRDRYLTQPAEPKVSSNIDKNYEELTQRRGATEGALTSKIKRWESWGKLRIRSTEDTAASGDTTDTKGGNAITTKSGSRNKPSTARPGNSPKPPLPGRSWSTSRITLPQTSEEEVEKRKSQFSKNLQVWKGERIDLEEKSEKSDKSDKSDKSETSEKSEKTEKTEKPEKTVKSEKKEDPPRYKSPSLSRKSKISSEKTDTKKGKDSSNSQSLTSDSSGPKATTQTIESKHRSGSLSTPERRRPRPRPSGEDNNWTAHNRTPIKKGVIVKDERDTPTGPLTDSGGDVGKSKSKRSTVGDRNNTDSPTDDDGKKFEERRKRLDERKKRLRDREAEDKARIVAEAKPDEKSEERKEKLAQAAALWKKKKRSEKIRR